MKSKATSILLCIILGISLLSGCNKNPSETQVSDETSKSEETKKTEDSSEKKTEETPKEEIVLEFSQWWEPELPSGSFRGIMDKFEKENPGIKVNLLSNPYASTKEQTIAGAATGTMSDIVGLDGAWVSDFVKQGSIADLSKLMKDYSYDESQLASQIKIDDKAYMIPVVNFVYPVFINDDMLAKANQKPPTNRTEFFEVAKALTSAENNTYGWVMPLSLESPNGIQNDVMSWVWASGKSMLKDGKPDLTNPDVKSAVEYIKTLYDAKVIAPGAFSMKEQDKVEEFTNGRVGMMLDTLAHVNIIRERNPELNFSISSVPAEDGYSGERGMPYASWGIGIAENCKNKEAAWKLVSFLMSESVNSEISSLANAFPGNSKSVPSFVEGDETFKAAFDIYQSGHPSNEFVGLPVAEQLMRLFDEQLQLMLEGDQTIDEMLSKTQESWLKEFK